MEREIRSFVRIYKSLGDPIRLKILKVIAKEGISVSKIAERIGITSPLASHHLKILEREHLADRKKDGVKVKYQLNKEGLDKLIIDFYRFLGIEPEIENIPKFLKTIQDVGTFLTEKPTFKNLKDKSKNK